MRRSGKTTRLVDKAVQHLFEKGSIKILLNNEIFNEAITNKMTDEEKANHFEFVDQDAQKENSAQRDFLDRFSNRLLQEHKHYVTKINETRFELKNKL